MSNFLTELSGAGCAFGAFALVYFVNIVYGLMMNCLVNGQKFDGARLVKSAVKLAVSGMTLVALVAAFHLIASGASTFGYDISPLILNVASVGAYVLLFIKGFFRAAADVYTKIRSLFDIPEKTNPDVAAIELYDGNFGIVNEFENGEVSADVI